MITCMHIRTFDIFFSFDWDSLLFLSPGIGYTALVFQVCKICAFDQSNALILIAKCKIFFNYFSKTYFILFYIWQFTMWNSNDNLNSLYTFCFYILPLLLTLMYILYNFVVLIVVRSCVFIICMCSHWTLFLFFQIIIIPADIQNCSSVLKKNMSFCWMCFAQKNAKRFWFMLCKTD